MDNLVDGNVEEGEIPKNNECVISELRDFVALQK